MNRRLTLTLACAALLCSRPLLAADAQLYVIAHKEVALERLSPERLTQIFLRQQQHWPDGQPIQPIDLREGLSLRAAFYNQITGRSLGQLRAFWARQSFTGLGLPPRQADSEEELLRWVQATPGAIGYVSRRPAVPGVKVLLTAELE